MSQEPDCLRPGGIKLTKYLLDLSGFNAGDKVLDVGCGKGLTLSYLRDSCKLRAMGLDRQISTRSLVAQNLPLIRAEMTSLPVLNASLDGIICECVLCLGERKTILNEFARTLLPKGRLAISDIYLKDAGKHTDCDTEDNSIKISKNDILQDLTSAGFSLLKFEDHSKALHSFVAESLFKGIDPTSCLPCGFSCFKARDLGYFILTATKEFY